MQASSEFAPLAAHFCSTQTWMAGVTVAQLMNNFPLARVSKPPVKMCLHRLVIADDGDDDVGQGGDGFQIRGGGGN